MRTRIFDSIYGEVKLRENYEVDDCCVRLDVYTGDNYDDWAGEICCDINDDDAIEKALDEIFPF